MSQRIFLFIAIVVGFVIGLVLLIIINIRAEDKRAEANLFLHKEIYWVCTDLDCDTEEERPYVSFWIINEPRGMPYTLKYRLKEKEIFCQSVAVGDTLVKAENSKQTMILKASGDTTSIDFQY
jgi:hypothetical protein